MREKAYISVFGGGPAGLAIGYYAKKRGIPFTIYESLDRAGGNCVTFEQGEFLIDSGAHRLHDQVPEVTRDIMELLGDDLQKVEAPSQIYHKGVMIDFPLSPLNLLKGLGIFTFTRAGMQVLRSRLSRSDEREDFESFALNTYGGIIAEKFLLNYSEKLWGAPCNRLSAEIAGRRMKGLTLKTFITEALFGRKAKTEHLEGSFYYPRRGIGVISEKLADYCGTENIRLNSAVTGLGHDSKRILSVEVNGKDTFEIEYAASTLPVKYFLNIMDPSPPEEVLAAANSLRFRNMIIAGFFLDKPSVNENATVYFPDADFVFTRVYEQKNRSPYTCPEGKTSLVAEIPAQEDDEAWKMPEETLLEKVEAQLVKTGWMEKRDVTGRCVKRLYNAYPILEIGFGDKMKVIKNYLEGFDNLRISGRNGRYVYAWIHDMMTYGNEIIEEYSSSLIRE